MNINRLCKKSEKIKKYEKNLTITCWKLVLWSVQHCDGVLQYLPDAKSALTACRDSNRITSY